MCRVDLPQLIVDRGMAIPVGELPSTEQSSSADQSVPFSPIPLCCGEVVYVGGDQADVARDFVVKLIIVVPHIETS